LSTIGTDIISLGTSISSGNVQLLGTSTIANTTVNLLDQLLVNLQAFMTICSTLVSTPPGTPVGPLNIVAGQMSTILNGLQQNLNSIKSKNNFTI
jgi:hypothetical protein